MTTNEKIEIFYLETNDPICQELEIEPNYWYWWIVDTNTGNATIEPQGGYRDPFYLLPEIAEDLA